MGKYDDKEKRALFFYFLAFLALSAGIIAGGVLFYRNFEEALCRPDEPAPEPLISWLNFLVVGLALLASALGVALFWRQRRAASYKQMALDAERFRESQAIFSSFLEYSPVYVFFKDSEARSLVLSRNYEQMLGRPLHELLGKTMNELFPSDLAERMVADDMRILNEGKRITVVEEFNGRVYETTKFPVFKDGKPHMLAGFTLDITERRRAEEELAQKTLMFRHLFEGSPEAIAILDDKDVVMQVNRSFETLFGYSESDARGRRINDLLAREPYLEDAQDASRKVFECGQIVQKEAVRFTKDGRAAQVWLIGYPIVVDQRVIGAYAIYRDITDRKRAEEALRLNEEKYRLLVERQTDLVVKVNERGEFLYVSPSYCKTFGKTEEELIGKSFIPLVHPDDVEATRAEMKKLYQPPYTCYVEQRAMTKDGWRWFSWVDTAELNENGEVVSIIGVGRDITDRRQAEDALRESRSLFHSLVESMPQNVFSKDLNGRFIFANQNYCLTEGRSLDEILGKTDFDLHPPELARKYGMDDRYVIESGQVIERVEVHQPLGGSASYVQVVKAPIYDAENRVKGMLGIFWDVTDRRRAEEALLESERLHRKMNENSPLGMHFYRLEEDKLIFIGANPAADKLLGVDNSQFIGKTIEEAFPSLRNTEAPQRYRQAAAEGVPWQTEQIDYDDGRIKGAFEVRAFQTTPQNMVAVFTDITLRKQAEEKILNLNAELEQRVRERTAQLESANKELEAFSYSVSHDLRAPLRGIDGWSQALAEDYADKLDEQGRRYIERVRSETQRMGRLIDDMLRLSRLTRAEMLWQRVDLSAIAEEIAERLKGEFPQRQVEVVIQRGVVADGDQRLLETVLENLLENAFKFTSKRPLARIEFGETKVEGERVFFVRDNGAGFDMAYSQKLFGVFQRMHKASEFPGTGVGLAIVQRVIHRHGGRIWAEAEVERGAAFYFTIEEKP